MSVDFAYAPATLERIDRSVADNHVFHFRLDEPPGVGPGQFMELSIPGIGAFPVSTAAWRGDAVFETCIRRAGRVTDALYQLGEGDAVGLRGPFGNGFAVDVFRDRTALLIAGGLGIAPLRGLLQALLKGNIAAQVILLYGGRSPEALLFRSELEELAAAGQIRLAFSVDFAAEYPWSNQPFTCRVGLVPELLAGLDVDPAGTSAAVCGPPALYGCVLEQLEGLGLVPGSIYASLERRMKCGIGQCCHCAVGGVFVCQQGPVFSLEQLRELGTLY